jgi:putative PEP-CTERM system TPR-repeat lipoprotein
MPLKNITYPGAAGALALAAVLALTACGEQGPAAQLAQARAYVQARDNRAAVIVLKNLLDKQPGSAEARLLLGTTLLDSGDAAGAESALRRALELGAAPAAVEPALARAMLVQAQYRTVITQFSATRLPDPRADADVAVTVANAHLSLNEREAAAAAAQRALQALPGHAPALLVQARLQGMEGHIDAALALLADLQARPAGEPALAEAGRLRGDLLLLGKNDVDAAIVAYRTALDVQPKDAASHAALINAWFAKGDMAAASAQFDRMKAAQPGEALTRYFEAQVAVARRDFPQARERLQELLRTAPDDATLLNLAGLTELELDALAQAEVYLAKAVQLQPGFATARRNLARVLLRGDTPSRAVAVLQPLLEGPLADAETLTLAAQALQRGGDTRSADALFARAAALKPTQPGVRVALARLARGAPGQAEPALAELQGIAANDPDDMADVALIRARIGRQEIDAALQAVARLEKKQPQSAIAADLRGRALTLRKDRAGARAAFETAVARDGRYFPAVASLAGLDLQAGQPAAAMAHLQALLKLDPRHVDALMAVAELRQRAGAPREEVAALIQRAAAANPQHARPRLTLVDLNLGARNLPAALAAAQEGAAALPWHAEMQERLARVLLASGDVLQAQGVFTRLASQRADSYRGHLGLAELALQRNDIAAAARAAAQAQKLAPDVPEVQRLAVAVALRENRPADALALVRRMQQLRPGDATGYIFEGEIQSAIGQREPAIAALRKAVALPEPAQAPALLYAALLQASQAAEAERFAQQWLRAHADDTAFRLSLGNAAMAQGQLALAESRFREVLARQPDNAVALNNTARALIGQKKAGAAELAERAVQVAPDQPQLQDTLALALASEGKYTQALDVQKRLLAAMPETPMYRLTLAKIYLQSGDKPQARAEIDTLLRAGNNFPGRAEAEQINRALQAS